MAFKTVFHVLDTTQDATTVRRAIEICDQLDAKLVVAAVGLAPPPPASPYGVVSSDIWSEEIAQGQANCVEFAKSLQEELSGVGPLVAIEPNYLDRGAVSAVVARYARYSDMTLIYPNASGAERVCDVVADGALFESGRPVVLMPESASAFPKVTRAMVAWDASVEASKAVREALPFLSAAGEVDLVLVDPVPSVDGHSNDPGSDLGRYLSRHGIAATIHRLPSQGRSVSDVLQQTAQELGAELMVMGGYAHSRLRQRFFGGTTTSILKSCSVPTLMAH